MIKIFRLERKSRLRRWKDFRKTVITFSLQDEVLLDRGVTLQLIIRKHIENHLAALIFVLPHDVAHLPLVGCTSGFIEASAETNIQLISRLQLQFKLQQALEV